METEDKQNEAQTETSDDKDKDRPESIFSKNKNLWALIAGLILILGSLLVLLLILGTDRKAKKPRSQKSPEEKTAEVAPKKHLSTFIGNYLTEYYQPDQIQPTKYQNEIKTFWKYRWKIDKEGVAASVQYNKSNNHINNLKSVVATEFPKDLTPKNASLLTEKLFQDQRLKEWNCESLTASLTANPSEGEAPLEDVDLKAKVTGNIDGKLTYLFDCESDSQWERIITTTSKKFTATDLCTYPENKEYSAKVNIIKENGVKVFDTTDPASNTTFSCQTSWTTNDKDKHQLIFTKSNQNPLTTAYLCRKPLQSENYESNYCY